MGSQNQMDMLDQDKHPVQYSIYKKNTWLIMRTKKHHAYKIGFIAGNQQEMRPVFTGRWKDKL